jgi:hypothetical protein
LLLRIVVPSSSGSSNPRRILFGLFEPEEEHSACIFRRLSHDTFLILADSTSHPERTDKVVPANATRVYGKNELTSKLDGRVYKFHTPVAVALCKELPVPIEEKAMCIRESVWMLQR